MRPSNYMERLREHPAEAFCVFLGGTALFYEVCAGIKRPNDQLISHAFDRAIERHPVATRVAVGAFALHLMNTFDDLGAKKADPISGVGTLFMLAHQRYRGNHIDE